MQQSPRLWHQLQSQPRLLNQQRSPVEECWWKAMAYRNKAVKLWGEARALEERAEELACQELSYQSGDKQGATRLLQHLYAVPRTHAQAATQLLKQSRKIPRTRPQDQQVANRKLPKDQATTKRWSKGQVARQRLKAKKCQEELSKPVDKEACQQEDRLAAAQQAQDRWAEAHHKATHGVRQEETPQQILGARQQEALQEFHRVVAEVEAAVALLHLDQLLQ